MSSSEFHEKLKSKSLCDFRLGTVATSDHETPSQRLDRQRDDQKIDHGKDVHCCEVLSGTVHGLDGISKLVEDRETGLLEETGRCPEEKEQKLQSNSADIGDVQVVCIVYPIAPGEGKESLETGRTYMLVEWTG